MRHLGSFLDSRQEVGQAMFKAKVHKFAAKLSFVINADRRPDTPEYSSLWHSWSQNVHHNAESPLHHFSSPSYIRSRPKHLYQLLSRSRNYRIKSSVGSDA